MTYHRIPDYDYHFLRQACNYKAEEMGDELPPALERLYWHNRNLHMKRAGSQLDQSPEWLLHTVFINWQQGGSVKEFQLCHQPDKPFRLIAKDLKYDELLDIWFRSTWRVARFRALAESGKAIKVQIVEEKYSAIERTFPMDECREYVIQEELVEA